MKKSIFIRLAAALAALILTLTLVSCGKPDTPPPAKAFSDMTLEEILDAIYKEGGYSERLTALIGTPVPEDPAASFDNYLVTSEINDNNFAYFLGETKFPFERAIASEPAISPSLLHTVCLVKIKEGDDGDALVHTIRNNADPMKWVCTGLSDKDVYVDRQGDIILLVMNHADGEALISAFRKVAQSEK